MDERGKTRSFWTSHTTFGCHVPCLTRKSRYFRLIRQLPRYPRYFSRFYDRSSWIPETGPYSELLRRLIGHLNLNLWALATFLSSQRRFSTQNMPISCPKSRYFSKSWQSKIIRQGNRAMLETFTRACRSSHFELLGSGHLPIKPKKVFNSKSAKIVP